MNINFSNQNCLIMYKSNALIIETGPERQNIPGHTDVLICEKYVFVNANSCAF